MTDDQPQFESLWIRISWKNSEIIVCNIYHPPNPIYNVSLFTQFLFSSVEGLCTTTLSDTLILAGDFNQLDDVTIVNNTGLISLVKKPTRGPNCLDRIYISKSCDVNIGPICNQIVSKIRSLLCYITRLIYGSSYYRNKVSA